MIVTRTEKHFIRKSHPLYEMVDNYCFKSKNLYNFANYTIRQEFIKTNKYIDYHAMWKMLKTEDVFKEIGSNSGQHTLKLLHQNWKSFFAILKDFMKNSYKYLGRPKIPKYLKKDGRYVWVLTNIQSKVIDGYLQFSFKPLKRFNNLIKTKVKGKHMQTRFIPKGDHYVMEIVYEKEIPQLKPETNRIIGIDLGINRFITVQNNFGEKSFAINGGDIKATNKYYNRLVARAKSKAKKVNSLEWSNKLQKITNKRNNKMEYFMHCTSRYIVNYCAAFNIDVVVIGYNQTWKQKSNMSKKNNQTFVQIPFLSFLSKLEYKLKEIGVKMIKTEESYTSKASFIDNDNLEKGIFSGKRIKRGLFQAADGTLINADVNGASNIIKKVFPDAFADGIKGVDLHPSIIKL